MTMNSRPQMPTERATRTSPRSMTRELRRYPGYRISKDGQVFHGLHSSPLPLEARDGKYQKQLTVRIGDLWERIDVLLSETFYEDAVLVPRDGNLMDLRADNVIPVKRMPQFSSNFKHLDADRMNWIWTCYEKYRIRVAFLAERTGLSHFYPEDFVKIIKAVLTEGIRL